MDHEDFNLWKKVSVFRTPIVLDRRYHGLPRHYWKSCVFGVGEKVSRPRRPRGGATTGSNVGAVWVGTEDTTKESGVSRGSSLVPLSSQRFRKVSADVMAPSPSSAKGIATPGHTRMPTARPSQIADRLGGQ